MTSPPGPTPPAPTRDLEVRERPLSETLPPYVVVLHNDDHNEMGHVVRALLASVPELDTERAMAIMIEAHLRGRAEVIACPLERAELYRDRLDSFGLTATIERA
ncbi:MAG: ATP-dependent Clp protease adaptor ClpS [Chloroflexi bacterium]|nr:ATP-dependent Clp protease adaptor ClpS [Chloroflexota bacterium]